MIKKFNFICLCCLYCLLLIYNLKTSNNMKTLYNRLSEENRKKIEEEAKNLPTTMLILVTFLRQNYAWNLMDISNAMSLHSALEPSKDFNLSTFIAFFSEK